MIATTFPDPCLRGITPDHHLHSRLAFIEAHLFRPHRLPPFGFATHPLKLRPQRRHLGINQRPNPLILARLLIARRHACVPQQHRRNIHKDRLILARGTVERLMKDPNVLVPQLRHSAIIPVPNLPVCLRVRKGIEPLDVLEVVNAQESVVIGAFRTAPVGPPEAPVLLRALAQLLVKAVKVVLDVLAPGGKGAQGVIKARAEMKDDDALARWLGSEGGVRARIVAYGGELGRGPVVEDVFVVGAVLGPDGVEDGAADGLEEQKECGPEGVPGWKKGESEELEDCSSEEKGSDGEKVLDEELLTVSR